LSRLFWRCATVGLLPFSVGACRCHSGSPSSQDAAITDSRPPSRGRALGHVAVLDRSICAIAIKGVVHCWLDSAKPVVIVGVPPIEEVTATRGAVFGRGNDGAVYLLSSSHHALGNTATKVTGSDGVRRIAASGAVLCGLKGAGEVTCWQMEDDGPSPGLPMAPTQLGTVAGAIDLSVGSTATCVLDLAGGVHCVGKLAPGLLGEKSFSATELGRVESLPSVESLYLAGSSACWRTREGDGTCSAAITTADAPWRDVGDFPGWSVAQGELPFEVLEVAAGPTIACARNTESMRCWGKLSGLMSPGGIGDVVGLTHAKHLVVGPESSCVLREDSTVWCWGWGAVRSPLAVEITQLRGVTALSVAADSICGIRPSGVVACRRIDERRAFVDVDLPQLDDRAITLAAGRSHHCALSATHDVWCWTFEPRGNQWGELGSASFVSGVPSRVAGVKALALSLRNDRSCAITVGGGASCWGRDDYEAPRLTGDVPHPLSPDPTPLWTSERIDDLIATSYQCVHTTAGDRWLCERLAHWKRLHPPSPMPGPFDPHPPAAGFGDEPWARAARRFLPDEPALAISPAGAILTSSSAPPPTLGVVIDLGAGDGYRCALRADGTVACWGSNGLGELGRGTLGVETVAAM
jgi:hypothetical protein